MKMHERRLCQAGRQQQAEEEKVASSQKPEAPAGDVRAALTVLERPESL